METFDLISQTHSNEAMKNVTRGVLSDTYTSREAEHQWKMTHTENLETFQRLVHEDHQRSSEEIVVIIQVFLAIFYVHIPEDEIKAC